MYKKTYYQRSNRMNASNQGRVQTKAQENQDEGEKSVEGTTSSHSFKYFRCFSHLPNNTVEYANQKQKENRVDVTAFKNNGGSKVMQGDENNKPADISGQPIIIQKMAKKIIDKEFLENYMLVTKPEGSETSVQYVKRIISSLDTSKYDTENINEYEARAAAEGVYNFDQKKKIDKKAIADKKKKDEYKSMAKSTMLSIAESLKQQQQIEKEREGARGSKDTKRQFEERFEAKNKATAEEGTRKLLTSLASEQQPKWRNKGMVTVKRTGMDEEGRKYILSALPALLSLLEGQLGTMGTTPDTWRSQSEWVKLTKDKAPSALDSHIRVDLESAATIHGIPFYGKVRVQGNQEGRTWAGFFFQFYKPRLTLKNIEEALKLSLKSEGCYACIIDQDDNVPLPEGE